MKKSELIAVLNAMTGDPEIRLFDTLAHERNVDSTTAGIHKIASVGWALDDEQLADAKENEEEFENWIALYFERDIPFEEMELIENSFVAGWRGRVPFDEDDAYLKKAITEYLNKPEVTGSHDQRTFTLQEVASPLIKWMAQNHHPHHTMIITNTSAELCEGKMCFSTDRYIVDGIRRHENMIWMEESEKVNVMVARNEIWENDNVIIPMSQVSHIEKHPNSGNHGKPITNRITVVFKDSKKNDNGEYTHAIYLHNSQGANFKEEYFKFINHMR